MQQALSKRGCVFRCLHGVTCGMCSSSQCHFTGANISQCEGLSYCNGSPSALLSLESTFPPPREAHNPSPYYSSLTQPSCNPLSLITQSFLLLPASPLQLRQSLTKPSCPPDSPIPIHWKSPSSYTPDIWLIIAPRNDPLLLDRWRAPIFQPSSWETPNLQAIFQSPQATFPCLCSLHA